MYAHIARTIQNFTGYRGVLLQVHKHHSSVSTHRKSCKLILPRHPPKLNSTRACLTSSLTSILSPHAWEHHGRGARSSPGRAEPAPCCPLSSSTSCRAAQPGHPSATAFPVIPTKYKPRHTHAVIKSIQTCKHAFHKIARSLAQTLICLQNDIN